MYVSEVFIKEVMTEIRRGWGTDKSTTARLQLRRGWGVDKAAQSKVSRKERKIKRGWGLDVKKGTGVRRGWGLDTSGRRRGGGGRKGVIVK